ncbi:MAG TPA: DUF1499 domain-containing protein [Myxococcota bacterium]|nr:DUF1499 domain-containing protein [Myxococcota bacterium]
MRRPVPRANTAKQSLVPILLLALGCASHPTAEGKGMPLAPCPDKPNCVSSLAPDEGHRVAPFSISRGDKGWAAVRDAVAAMPRTTIVEERPGYLHAECRSRIFRFVDDLELERSRAGDRVDVRSASRVGYGDWGVNRARVESLRDALATAGVVKSSGSAAQ